MLLDAIVGLAVLVLVLGVVVGLLKLVFAVVLLPLKLAFWLAQGLLVLVIGLPLLLLGGVLLGAVVPALIVLLAPVWILGVVAWAILA